MTKRRRKRTSSDKHTDQGDSAQSDPNLSSGQDGSGAGDDGGPDATSPAPDPEGSHSPLDSGNATSESEAVELETSGSNPAVVGVMPSMSRILSMVMLILGIVAVGALFYKVMAGFFVPLFLAVLLVVIFRPVHEWINQRVGNRPRLAALATTAIVMGVVLMPIILVISVAATQFTVMVSHVNFDDLTSALDRAREQLGISLEHEEKFRRLDYLADTFDQPEIPGDGFNADGESVSRQAVLRNIEETLSLLKFLQDEVEGPPEADLYAKLAEDKLAELAELVRRESDAASDEIARIDAEEQFHRQSVSAAAAIRTWMRTKLGGTFRSQIKLLANPSAEDFKKLLQMGREALQPRFITVTSATGSFLLQSLIGLVVLVIAIYFFLIDGSAMVHTLMRLSPLDDAYEERLLLEFERTSRAVVLASVLSALVQGLLAAIAFWMLGFDSVILLFLLTAVMALVPFLGAAAVWVPCAIYLGAVEQRWTAAIFLAIYGATIVSSIDNVIKMFVLHGRSTLHPLFALLSVLGGVKVFGPIGILVGPMVVVFLQTLLEILNHELEERSVQKAQQQE